MIVSGKQRVQLTKVTWLPTLINTHQVSSSFDPGTIYDTKTWLRNTKKNVRDFYLEKVYRAVLA